MNIVANIVIIGGMNNHTFFMSLVLLSLLLLLS